VHELVIIETVTVSILKHKKFKGPAKLNIRCTIHSCVFLYWNFANEKRRKKV